MAIILTYHTLVERDTRFVSRKWQFSIILLLSGIVVLCLIAGFKIHALDGNYDDNCFIDSQIVFKAKPDELVIFGAPGKQSRKLVPIMERYDSVVNEHDLYIFERTEIDEFETTWGDPGNCIFISLTPLFFSFCAIVWICMFITCGHGGSTKSFIAEKPWIIVVPSLIFFILATIATFIVLIFVKTTIDHFCEQLDEYLDDDYYCGFLLEQFSLMNKDSSNFERDFYSTILRSLVITNVLWLICAVIMVLRIIFVIDFQLVRVTISHIDSTITVGRNMQVLNKGGGGFDEKQDYDNHSSVHSNVYNTNQNDDEGENDEDEDGENLDDWLYEGRAPPNRIKVSFFQPDEPRENSK